MGLNFMIFSTGNVVFTGGNYIKIDKVNENGYEAHTWVKTKRAWTKKTSLYGFNGTTNWQILNDEEIETLNH